MTGRGSRAGSATGRSTDVRAFDADNHYYEAIDAFTRHIEPEFARRCMQWAQVDGRTRLLVGGRVNRFLPDPTFSKLAAPGVLEDYFRGRTGGDVVSLFGDLEPPRPEYRDRDARLRVMDGQGLDGAFFFPTLGVGMETALAEDIPAVAAAFRAFNRWLDDDWGFHHRDRIFAAPYLTLCDVDNAVTELRWALDRGARIVVMQAGPVRTAQGFRAPSDPAFDPFWALADSAGIVVAYHGGDTAYSTLPRMWGEAGGVEAFRVTALSGLLSPTPIADTMAAHLAHGLFHRFPHLRMAAIETGSEWVPPLFKRLGKAFAQHPASWREDPRDTFRRHVWVAPFHENDLAELKNLIGARHMLLGSDWPHTEGLAEPLAFVDDLRRAGFDEDEISLVRRDNALALSRPAA